MGGNIILPLDFYKPVVQPTVPIPLSALPMVNLSNAPGKPQLPKISANPNIFPQFGQDKNIPVTLPISSQKATLKIEDMISPEAKGKASKEGAEKILALVKMTIGNFAEKITPLLHSFGAGLPALFTAEPILNLFSSTLNMAELSPILERIKFVHQDKLYELKKKYPKLEKNGVFDTLKKSISVYQLEFIDIILSTNPSFNTKALKDFLDNLSNPKIVKAKLKWFKEKIKEKTTVKSGKKTIETSKYNLKDLFVIMANISSEKDLADKQFDWLDKHMPDKIDFMNLKQLTAILKNLKPEIADEQLTWINEKLKQNPNISADILNAIIPSLKAGIVKNQTDWADDKLKNNPKFNLEMLSTILSSLNPDIYDKQLTWTDNKLKQEPDFSIEMMKSVLSHLDKSTIDWKLETFEKLISFSKKISPKMMDEFLKDINPDILDEYTLMVDKLLELYNFTKSNLFKDNPGPKQQQKLKVFFENSSELAEDIMHHMIGLNGSLTPEVAKRQYECFCNYSKLFEFHNFKDINETFAVVDGLIPKNINEKIEWLNEEIAKGHKREGNNIYSILRTFNPELAEEQIAWADNHVGLSDESCCSALVYLQKEIFDKQLDWVDEKLKENPNIHHYIIAVTLYALKPEIIKEQLDWVDDYIEKKGKQIDGDKDSDIILGILPNFKKELYERQKTWANQKLKEQIVDSSLIGAALECMTPELADKQFLMADKIFNQNPNISPTSLQKYLQNEEGLARAELTFKDIIENEPVRKAKKTNRNASIKDAFLQKNNQAPEKFNYEELTDTEIKLRLDDTFFSKDEFLDSQTLNEIYNFLDNDEIIPEKRQMSIDLIKLLESEKSVDNISQSEVFLKIKNFITNYKAMEQVYTAYQTRHETVQTNIPHDFSDFILHLNDLNINGTDTISKNNIIKYLMKLNDWFSGEKAQRCSLNEFMDTFDVDDCVESEIIEYFVEHFYIMNDFNTIAKDGNGRQENITISKKAKQAIYNKYKNQNDYFFLKAFEKAASIIVSHTNISGVKEFTTNNAKEQGKKEIKLAGHDDRIFNRNDDSFFFDIFDSTGDK